MKPNLFSARRTVALAASAIAGMASLACETPPTLGERERTHPALVEMESCDALAATMRASLKEFAYAEVGKNALIEREELWDTLPPELAYGGLYGGVEFQPSRYDQRVQPDESVDIVKVRGDLVYVLDSEQLEVLDVSDPTALQLVATLPVEGAGLGLVAVEGGVLVLSSTDPWRIKGDHPLYPILNPILSGSDGSEGDTAPPDLTQLIKIAFVSVGAGGLDVEEQRSAYVPGRFVGGHQRGSAFTMAVFRAPNLYELNTYPRSSGLIGFISDITPWDGLRDQEQLTATSNNNRIIDRFDLTPYYPTAYLVEGAGTTGTLETLTVTTEDCANTFTADDDMGRGFTTLLTFDASSLESASLLAILGGPGSLKGRDGNVVLATPSQEDWWHFDDEGRFDPATNLHRFTYVDGALTYAGSARLEGALDDDHWSVELDRVVATTTPGDALLWWRDVHLEPGATIHLLNPDLSLVGAPIGVTFEGALIHAGLHDDACTLSTSSIADPFTRVGLLDRQLAPVEIQGLITDTLSLDVDPMVSLAARLVAIGPSDDGTDVDLGALRLSYFTVGDGGGASGFSLVESAEWSYGAESDGWFHPASVAATVPLALQHFGDVVTVPLARYRRDPGASQALRYLSKLKLVEIGDGGIVQVGEIDHGSYFTSAADVLELRNPAIFRVLEREGYFIAISDRAATSHLPFEPTPVSEVELPGSLYQELYIPCFVDCEFKDPGVVDAVPVRP